MDDNLSSFEYSHNDSCIYAMYKDKTGSLRVSAKVKNTDLPLPIGNPMPKQSKYVHQMLGLNGVEVPVDVYRVLDAFNVTSSPTQHRIKKDLVTGRRGHKDHRQDLVDIVDSAKAELLMYDQKQALLK